MKFNKKKQINLKKLDQNETAISLLLKKKVFFCANEIYQPKRKTRIPQADLNIHFLKSSKFFSKYLIFYIQLLNSKKMQPQKKKKEIEGEYVNQVTQIFSKTRDVDVLHPYHLDGDMEMYNDENMKEREKLAHDADIVNQINQIVGLFEFEKDDKLFENPYKRVQKQMALALRPDIEEEELEFVVDQDWQLDSKDGFIQRGDLPDKIFQLVDVWTTGVDKMEYITFLRLLKKKVKNGLLTEKKK